MLNKFLQTHSCASGTFGSKALLHKSCARICKTFTCKKWLSTADWNHIATAASRCPSKWGQMFTFFKNKSASQQASSSKSNPLDLPSKLPFTTQWETRLSLKCCHLSSTRILFECTAALLLDDEPKKLTLKCWLPWKDVHFVICLQIRRKYDLKLHKTLKLRLHDDLWNSVSHNILA